MTSPCSGDTILTELDPYTLYKVSVAAATGAGLGNYSEVSESRTFGDVPVAVVMLEELNKSCPGGLFVQWAELDPRQFRGPEDEIRLVIVYTAQGGSDGAASDNITVNYTGNNVSIRLHGCGNWGESELASQYRYYKKIAVPVYAYVYVYIRDMLSTCGTRACAVQPVRTEAIIVFFTYTG